MTDSRQDPHGGHGRRAEKNIAKEFETQTGHPPREPSDDSSRLRENELAGDMPPSTDSAAGQHARKGQAQSPRELNLNQPEKKRDGHR